MGAEPFAVVQTHDVHNFPAGVFALVGVAAQGVGHGLELMAGGFRLVFSLACGGAGLA